MKFLNNENTSTKIITSDKKIMTSCAGNYNFNVRCHNIDARCYNFFRKRGIFSSFKIFHKKIKLWALNTHWKAIATWPNQTS